MVKGVRIKIFYQYTYLYGDHDIEKEGFDYEVIGERQDSISSLYGQVCERYGWD